MHHSRGEAEVELMRRLKGLLDPNGILNPGRVFDSITAHIRHADFDRAHTIG